MTENDGVWGDSNECGSGRTYAGKFEPILGRRRPAGNGCDRHGYQGQSNKPNASTEPEEVTERLKSGGKSRDDTIWLGEIGRRRAICCAGPVQGLLGLSSLT